MEAVYQETNTYLLASIIREDIGDSKRLVLEKASKQIGEIFILCRNLEKYSRSNGAMNKDKLIRGNSSKKSFKA